MRRKRNRWLPTEDETLRDCWPAMTAKEIATLLPRHSWRSVKDRASLLGIFSGERHGTTRIWTLRDDQSLTRMWSGGWPIAEIADVLNRTQSAVKQRAGKVLNLPRRHKRITATQVATIRQAVLTGATLREAAALAGVSKSGAEWTCNRSGVKSRYKPGPTEKAKHNLCGKAG